MVKRGSVKSISMTNFMGNNDVQVEPGGGFNVVLGPNGSGKSTIVAAIVLGLGGDVSTLSRQNNIGEYVKRAVDNRPGTATINLQLYKSELDDDDDAVHEVSAAISHQGNPDHATIAYTMDGEPASREQVRALAFKLQIQTNNLCQFLPQEVVRKFPEMSPEKIFESTVRAVGDQETLRLDDDLHGKRAEEATLRSTISTKENTMGKIQKKRDEFEEINKQLKSREDLHNTLELLGNNVKYINYQKLLSEKKPLRTQYMKADTKMKDCQDKLNSFTQKETAKETEAAEIIAEQEVARKELERTVGYMRDAKVERLNRDLSQVNKQLESLNTKARSSQRATLAIKEDLESKTKELQEKKERWGNTDPLRLSLNQKRADLLSKIKQGQAQLKIHKADKVATDAAIKSKENKKRELESLPNLKLLGLESRNKDAFKGVQWLRQNKGQGFKATVHEPPMLSMNLAEDRFKIPLQKLIGSSELEAFICENSDDTNLLLRKLRTEQKLQKINVVTALPLKTARDLQTPRLVRPEHTRYYELFLIDAFDAPAMVKSHLVQKYHLNKIPLFKKGMSESDVKSLPATIQKFWIDLSFHKKSTGRYSRTELTAVEECHNDKALHFQQSVVNVQELESLNTDIAALKKEREKLEAQKSTLVNAADEDEKKYDDCEREIGIFQQYQKDICNLESEVGLLTTNLELATSGASIEEKRQVLLKQRANAAKQFPGAVKEIREIVLKAKDNELLLERKTIVLSKVHGELAAAKTNRCEMKRKLDDVQQTRQKFVEAVNQNFQAMGQLKKELQISGNETIPPETQETFDKFSNQGLKTLESFKFEIQRCEHLLRALPQFTPQEAKAAKKAVHEHTLQQVALKGLTDELEGIERSIMEKKSRMISRVQDLISRVDERFSAMMAQLENVGSIRLLGADENAANLSGFGIGIFVWFNANKAAKRNGTPTRRNNASFNGDEDLQRLSATAHSGGEKSVATALYMMALQELTDVPFRCVDEINQGMDEDNERMVWTMLLDTATKYDAQYFYMAPKFPRQLQFNDQMTVIICANGLCQRSEPRRGMNVDRMLERAKAKKRPNSRKRKATT